MRSVEWREGDIVIIDQTILPKLLDYRTLSNIDDVVEAINGLRVRGAPALGIVGAMGVAQAAMRPPSANSKTVLERAEQAGRVLAATRPTAVNLVWAIERVLARARKVPLTAGPLRLAQTMADEAIAIQAEDEAACDQMAKHALEFFRPKGVVLTHCNTGALCTGGIGTALGAIKRAHAEGLGVVVIATETRPLLQGARLTAWELAQTGIPHALVVDAAAPGLIARGEVSLVIVGADRIAANGDVVNKVGTYPLALAAKAASIPFVVVAPTSTVDPRVPDGARVEIEERDPSEVTSVLGAPVAPPGTSALNPAFDVTPAELITAIVTEKGIARHPLAAGLRRLRDGAVVPTRASKSSARVPPAKKPARRAAAPAAKKKVKPSAGKRKASARPKAKPKPKPRARRRH